MRRSGWPEIGGPTNEACGEACGPPYHCGRPALDGSCLVRARVRSVRLYEVLRRLKAAGIDAKVVFLTMHADAQFATAALRAGASGYVLKHAAGGARIFPGVVPRYIFGPVSPDIPALCAPIPCLYNPA